MPRTIADFPLYRMHRVLLSAGGVVTRMCEGGFDITRREWRVLAMLAAHGPVQSAALATHASLDRPTTSKAVSSLVAMGLVQRGERRKLLALTELGEELYRRMFPAIRDVNLAVLSPLSAQEVLLLDDMLARIQARADVLAQDATLPAADRRGGRSRGLRAVGPRPR